MCCKTLCTPLNKEIAEAILVLGEFHKLDSGIWERIVPTEETRVTAMYNYDALVLTLNPAVHNMEAHAHKREAAGIMYSIAAIYGEKVRGEVRQCGINVPECMVDTRERLLAQYPEHRLDYDALCPGFQQLMTVDE